MRAADESQRTRVVNVIGSTVSGTFLVHRNATRRIVEPLQVYFDTGDLVCQVSNGQLGGVAVDNPDPPAMISDDLPHRSATAVHRLWDVYVEATRTAADAAEWETP